MKLKKRTNRKILNLDFFNCFNSQYSHGFFFLDFFYFFFVDLFFVIMKWDRRTSSLMYLKYYISSVRNTHKLYKMCQQWLLVFNAHRLLQILFVVLVTLLCFMPHAMPFVQVILSAQNKIQNNLMMMKKRFPKILVGV